MTGFIGALREASQSDVPEATPIAGSCPACATTNPGPVGGTCRSCGSPLRLFTLTLPGVGANSDITVPDPPPVAESVVSFAKKAWNERLHKRDPGGQGGGQFTRGGAGGASGAPRTPRGAAPYSPTGARATQQRETHGASGADADMRRRARTARASSDAGHMEEFTLPTAVNAKLVNMFAPEKDSPKLKQPTEDGDELFDEAARALSGFQQVLDLGEGLSKALGAKVSTSDGVVADPESSHILIAPLKGRERSDEKVATKYGGDYSRLGDVVRATVVVPRVQDLPSAVDALRREAAKRGWKIHAPENRFAFEPGSHVNTGPLPSGYMDAAVQLVSPSGIVSEVQIQTAPIFAAKAGAGHKLYEQERSIVARASLAGRPMTPEEMKQVEGLQQQAKALYTQAFADSYKPRRRGRAPERADTAGDIKPAAAAKPAAVSAAK